VTTRCCASALLLGLFTCLAPAKTINVPADHPTVKAGLQAAAEGDTVLLAPGTYKEVLDMPERVSLIGRKRDSCVILGKENKPVIKGENRCLLSHLTIKGGSAGVRCDGKAMVIENCLIAENKEAGIHCLISLPIIRNNLILRNEWTGVFCQSARGLNAAIEHNVIADNKYSGINLAGKTEVLIRSNVLVNNGQFAIWVDRDSRRSRIEYNDAYNNRKQFNQYAVVNATNLTLDPAFPQLHADAYDYGASPGRSFRQMGAGGSDIGLVSDEELHATVSDKDRDDVADSADQCPGVPEDNDGFQDDDGCPDFDNDNDGIYDKDDKCPDEAEDKDGFQDFDGCPDLDNDNDGIADSTDQCPDKPETKNGFKDEDGCPDQAPAPTR
jgi:OmpA-OmpF porin, OOP family